jgi:hypothetical protein
LAPPNLHSSTRLSQGLPRVHSHIAPRGAVSLRATPSPSHPPTPTRTSPPPAIAPRSICQLTPTVGQATPRRLKFADTPAQPIPRVPSVSPPAKPPAPPALLPICKPISHCTRSRAQAPLALFTYGRPYHEQVKYHIPPTKATRPAEEPLAFAGLCKTFHMKPAEVDAFAFLCEALTLEDRPGLLALSVLDPATGKFLEHRQLCRNPRYKATWDTSYANELGRLCQGIGAGSTPSAQRVSGTNTFYSLTITTYHCIRGKKCAIPWWYVKCVRIKMIRIAPNITIGGNCICFPGIVGTNTALLELVKLLLNSVLS